MYSTTATNVTISTFEDARKERCCSGVISEDIDRFRGAFCANGTGGGVSRGFSQNSGAEVHGGFQIGGGRQLDEHCSLERQAAGQLVVAREGAGKRRRRHVVVA